MNVLTLLGSPRPFGNTALALSFVEDRLLTGHSVEQVRVPGAGISGCIGCMACQGGSSDPGCVLRDGGPEAFEKILAADLLVYASPLYTGGFPSQMKALLDRQFCLVKGAGTPDARSLVKGKRAGLLVTCAGPEESNADLIVEQFKRMAAVFGFRVAGVRVIPFCTTPDEMPPDLEQDMAAFADRLTAEPGHAELP